MEKCLGYHNLLKSKYDINCGEDCNESESASKFRKLSLKLHPDRGGNQEEYANLSSAYQDVVRDRCTKKYHLK